MKSELIMDFSRYVDIGPLPSMGLAYREQGIEKINIRPFTVKELRLISQAIHQSNLDYFLQAVDAVIDVPVAQVTIGDFFYLLEWLRIQSFPKSPQVVNWDCSATYYTEDVDVEEPVLDEEGNPVFEDPQPGVFVAQVKTQKVTKPKLFKGDPDTLASLLADGLIQKRVCSNHNTEIIRNANIEVICLTDQIGEDFELDPRLDFPRAFLIPQIARHTDKEDQFLVTAAQWLKQGRTLEDKIAILEAEPDLDLYDAAFSVSETAIHGIKETVRLSCSNCGTSYYHNLELNPMTFFRK